MLSATEPLIAAVDGAPSLWAAFARMTLFVVLLAGGAAAWLYWQRRSRITRRHLHVLDRAFLCRGVSVALLEVDSKRLLVGCSADGVRLIRDLGKGIQEPVAASFTKTLAEVSASKEHRA